MAGRSVSGAAGGLAALVLATALALAGCGSGSTGVESGTYTDPSAGDPAAILAVWQSFPVDATPRPPVPTGPTVLDPEVFPAAKDEEAYQTGRFELATALPEAPATADGYPVVSAKAAFDRLRAAHPDTTIKGGRVLPMLRVVTAALGQAYFDTDRGRRQLPAWRLGLDRAADPVWVLAVDSTALWTGKPTAATDLGFQATPDADGRSVRLDFIGGADEPTPCGITYTAGAKESATAVVIRLESERQRPASHEVACDLAGHPRTVTLRLAEPLGGRVLLTPYGVPLPVTSS